MASRTLGRSRRAPGAAGSVRGGSSRRRGHDRGQPERHVDQEDRAPAGAEQVQRTRGRRRAADRATAARPITGPNTAKAFCWPSSPNSSRISPKPCGTMIAATAPCSARAAISVVALGASAHSTDASDEARRSRPSRTRRRPQRVAEPAAEQQRRRHGQRVGGGEPLQVGVGAAEVATDRRRRGLGDGRVQQVHDRRGDDDDQAEPRGAAGAAAPQRRPGGG